MFLMFAGIANAQLTTSVNYLNFTASETSKPVIITNNGDSVVIITEISALGTPFSYAGSTTEETIAAGGTKTITIGYTAGAAEAKATLTITYKIGKVEQIPLNITLKGAQQEGTTEKGAPILYYDKNKNNLKQFTTTIKEQTITITNTGTAEAKITEISQLENWEITDLIVGTVIKPETDKSFKVTYKGSGTNSKDVKKTLQILYGGTNPFQIDLTASKKADDDKTIKLNFDGSIEPFDNISKKSQKITVEAKNGNIKNIKINVPNGWESNIATITSVNKAKKKDIDLTFNGKETKKGVLKIHYTYGTNKSDTTTLEIPLSASYQKVYSFGGKNSIDSLPKARYDSAISLYLQGKITDITSVEFSENISGDSASIITALNKGNAFQISFSAQDSSENYIVLGEDKINLNFHITSKLGWDTDSVIRFKGNSASFVFKNNGDDTIKLDYAEYRFEPATIQPWASDSVTITLAEGFTPEPDTAMVEIAGQTFNVEYIGGDFTLPNWAMIAGGGVVILLLIGFAVWIIKHRKKWFSKFHNKKTVDEQIRALINNNKIEEAYKLAATGKTEDWRNGDGKKIYEQLQKFTEIKELLTPKQSNDSRKTGKRTTGNPDYNNVISKVSEQPGLSKLLSESDFNFWSKFTHYKFNDDTFEVNYDKDKPNTTFEKEFICTLCNKIYGSKQNNNTQAQNFYKAIWNSVKNSASKEVSEVLPENILDIKNFDKEKFRELLIPKTAEQWKIELKKDFSGLIQALALDNFIFQTNKAYIVLLEESSHKLGFADEKSFWKEVTNGKIRGSDPISKLFEILVQQTSEQVTEDNFALWSLKYQAVHAQYSPGKNLPDSMPSEIKDYATLKDLNILEHFEKFIKSQDATENNINSENTLKNAAANVHNTVARIEGEQQELTNTNGAENSNNGTTTPQQGTTAEQDQTLAKDAKQYRELLSLVEEGDVKERIKKDGMGVYFLELKEKADKAKQDLKEEKENTEKLKTELNKYDEVKRLIFKNAEINGTLINDTNQKLEAYENLLSDKIVEENKHGEAVLKPEYLHGKSLYEALCNANLIDESDFQNGKASVDKIKVYSDAKKLEEKNKTLENAANEALKLADKLEKEKEDQQTAHLISMQKLQTEHKTNVEKLTKQNQTEIKRITDEKQVEIEKQKTSISTKESRIVSLEEQKNKKTDDLKQLQEKFDSLNADKISLELKVSELKQLQKEMSGPEKKIADWELQIAENKIEIEKLNSEILLKEKQSKSSTELVEYYENEVLSTLGLNPSNALARARDLRKLIDSEKSAKSDTRYYRNYITNLSTSERYENAVNSARLYLNRSYHGSVTDLLIYMNFLESDLRLLVNSVKNPAFSNYLNKQFFGKTNTIFDLISELEKQAAPISEKGEPARYLFDNFMTKRFGPYFDEVCAVIAYNKITKIGETEITQDFMQNKAAKAVIEKIESDTRTVIGRCFGLDIVLPELFTDRYSEKQYESGTDSKILDYFSSIKVVHNNMDGLVIYDVNSPGYSPDGSAQSINVMVKPQVVFKS